MELTGEVEELGTYGSDRSNGSGCWMLDTGYWMGMVSERHMDQIGEIVEIGFFDCAGFEAECQRVWVGRDCYCGDFEEFLLEVTAADY